MSDPFARPEPSGESGAYAAGTWPALDSPPQPEQRTNGFAIAALIFGIIGGILFAVIFGIIALVQIPKRGQKGKGLAIAGLVLAGVWTVLIGAVLVAVVMTSAGRDASGEITKQGEVSTIMLEVGDCVNDLEESQGVTSLPAVPCDKPHEGEVFALFDLTDSEYPAQDKLFAEAENGCTQELGIYAPKAMKDPMIGLFYFYPHESAWPDDREVVCVAVATSGMLKGSIADR